MDVKDIVRRTLPASFKDLLLAHRQLEKLSSLSISKSGCREEIPFLKLEGGMIFYGYPPTQVQRFVYQHFVDEQIRQRLTETAFAVALDVLLRYVGPERPDDHIKSGKYYDLIPGSVVVECGAYIGAYAMRAAQLVGRSGHVIAIEPVEENLRRLSLNVAANNFSNITIVPKALWMKKCRRSLFQEKRQRASLVKGIVRPTRQAELVECDTLDNIIRNLDVDQIDFVRMQINGAEVAALKGMTEILEQDPTLLISAPYQQSYQDVIAILQEKGYRFVKKRYNILAWKKNLHKLEDVQG
jgi:FkbM family methyltransferase